MGGGDVKLMAGFGALLGAGRLLEAALWTAGIGGIVAVGAIAWRTIRRMTGREVLESATGKPDESIPYAPAIALGVWLSLVPKS
jgi:prepilin peptidase CpaA